MVIDKEAVNARFGGKRVDGGELLEILIVCVGVAWFRRIERTASGDGGIKQDQLQISCEWHRIRRGKVADQIVVRVIAASRFRKRPYVEQTEPALPGTPTLFMVAARNHPWRGSQQLCGRLEQIRLPRVPAISPRAALASGNICRAGILPVVVVADMNYQVRGHRGSRVCDSAKRPLFAVQTGLPGAVGELHATTGVANDDNALRFGFR